MAKAIRFVFDLLFAMTSMKIFISPTYAYVNNFA